jgi:hypothetical protein
MHFFKNRLNFFILILGFSVIFPVFIYFSKLGVNFNSCENIDMNMYNCPTISFGTLFLILTSFYFIPKNKFFLLVSIFLVLYTFEFLFYDDLTLFLRVLKSIVPFILFFSFLSIKDSFRLNEKIINYILSKFIPYCVILFQLIFIFSTPEIFKKISFIPDNTEFWPNLFINEIKIYNYNQYFSFILVLMCGIRIFFSSSKKEMVFLILLMIYSCVHSWNFTALICSLFIIFFKIFFLYNLKSKINHKIFRLISYCMASLLFLIPIFSSVILDFGSKYLHDGLSIHGDVLYSLYTRLIRFSLFFSHLDISNLFYGIYPRPLLTQQIHSQFLEYISFFGILRSLLLLIIIIYLLKYISKIEFLLPLSIIIGLGGGLNEIFTHLYTGQIIFFYICFCSNIYKKKTG